MLGRTFFGIAAAVLLAAVGLPGQVQAGSVLPAETEADGPGELPPFARGPAAGRPTVIPGAFIVQVEEGADPGPIAAAVARFTGGTVRHVYTNALKGFAIRVPPGLVIADIFAAHPQVLKVEPDLEAFAFGHSGHCSPWPTCKGGGGDGNGNGGPTVNDDTATTDANTAVTINVLENDSGKKLSVDSVTQPAQGAAAPSGNNKSVIYTPNTGFYGDDSFGYTITDKNGKTASAKVTVTVTVTGGGPANAQPVADPQSVATAEGTTLGITLTGSDADLDPLTYAIVTGPANGALSGTPPNVTYTPGTDFFGPDSFTFKVNDGTVDSLDATVSIDVTPVNDPPVATNDAAATPKDTPVTIDVLANDSDVDGNPLSVTSATQGTNGATAVNPDDTITYTPDAGFTGSDSFDYTSSDGNGGFANATVDVTVTEPSAQVTAPGILRIGANPAPGNCGDINIAILDTGIDLDHPDLNVNVAMSQDFTGIGTPDDEHGHGSHVGGIVGALNNLFGVVGVCPGATLISYRVLNASGSGSLSGIVAALDQVVVNAGVIAVVNMSLGAIGVTNAFHTAVQNTVNAGVVVAVAAGNDGEDIYGADGTRGTSDDAIPASYPEAATIAAMADYDGLAGGLVPDPVTFCVLRRGNSCFATIDQYDDTLAFFSNHNHNPGPGVFINSPGGALDVAAPGVVVYSADMNGGYTTKSGTSMASPHYAGAVARYLLANGGRDQNGDSVVDGVDVTLIRQGIVDTAESQDNWRTSPPPTSFIEGIADNCAPVVRPPTEDIDCNFEPLVDVEAFEPGTS